jgi:hypothetical protein
LPPVGGSAEGACLPGLLKRLNMLLIEFIAYFRADANKGGREGYAERRGCLTVGAAEDERGRVDGQSRRN